MVGTICVAVCDRLNPRTRFLAVVFLFSNITGGVIAGLFAACLGTIMVEVAGSHTAAAAVLASLLLLVVEESRPLRVRIVSLTRQVNQTVWARRGPVAAACVWGFELGTGVTTVVNTWAIWAMMALVGMSGDLLLGGVTGAVFGSARGSQPLLTGTLSRRDLGTLTASIGRQYRRLHVGPLAGVVSITLFWLYLAAN